MLSSSAFRIIIWASMAVDLAVAHPLRLFIEESPVLAASTSRVTYREVAFICIFLTALLFSIVWAFILALLRDTRASAFITRLFQSTIGNDTLRYAGGLPLPLPLTARPDPSWVIPPSHTTAAPSGGVAYPLSASRRGRWYHP